MSCFARRLLFVVGAFFSAYPVIATPDLFLKSFTVDPSGTAGSKVNYNLTIVNQGTGGRADFSTAEMRLSTSNVTPNSSDSLLLSIFVGDMAPGETLNSSGTTIPIPANMSPGAYYIWVVLDVNDTAGQGTANRANDRTMVPFTVTGTPGPDLIPQSFTVSPSGNAGSNVSYSVTIRNQGTGIANSSTTQFRLSDSSVAPASSDPVLLSLPTPAIDAGATKSLSGTNLPIPANATLGTKYIWVTLDATGSAGQGLTNQANDRAKATFTVTGASLPDLVTQSLTVNPVSGAAGSQVAILYAIVNQGTATANASRVEIRLGTSSAALSSNDPLIHSFQTDSIPANGLIHFGTTLSIPPDTSPGTKYIWVSLDVDNAAGQGTANQANDRTNTAFTVIQAVPTGTLTGTVRDSVTSVAISGASVSFGGSSTSTVGSGVYTLPNLTCASSTFTVIKSGYQTVADSYSLTNCPGTSIRDVSLMSTPTPACALTCSADVASAGLVGATLPFVGTSSVASCSDATSYSWTFGDGTSATGSSVTHAYNSAGFYNWTLSVARGGATCTRNGTVTISSASSGLPVIEYFRANRDQIAVGGSSDLTWSVRNASTVILDGVGNVAPNSGTTVVPTSTTTYKLIAANSAGSQVATVTVRVDSLLNVSIHADRVTGVVPLSVVFTVLASGGVPQYSYRWSFGDTSQQTTHRWTDPTPEDVFCTVTDAHGTSQKSNILHIVPSPPNATISLEFLDLTRGPNPSSPSPYTRIGASADGATVVRVHATSSSPGTVTFKFSGKLGSGFDGGLFSAKEAIGTPKAQLTVATTGDGAEYAAEVFYKVPDDFANTGSTAPDARSERPLSFSAQLAGVSGSLVSTGDKSFKLRHAPVVFVHGIWSHSGTWDDFPIWRELRDRGEALAPGWDGIGSIDSGAQQIQPFVKGVLSHMRAGGIAASRADVVAHSFGGLIAKRLAATNGAMIHKLITIDTPHFGSALADFLVAHRTNLIIKKFIQMGYPIGSAIDDLRIHTAAASQARSLPTGELRAHSIVGVASDDEPCVTWEKNQLPSLVAWLCLANLAENPLFGASPGVCRAQLLTALLGFRPNDEVVDTTSQAGGLNAATTFGSGSLLGQHVCTSAHTVVTSNGFISNRVRQLLNTSVVSGPFEKYSLAAAHANGVGEFGANPASAVHKSADATSIRIQSPTDGQAVLPGSALDVLLSTGVTFAKVTVATPDETVEAAGNPLHARIDIPANRVGQYPILVFGSVAADVPAATDSVNVIVKPNAAISSVMLSPLELFLTVGESGIINVRGVFDDGIARTLTGSADVAFSSSDITIVVVQPDGKAYAVGTGQAIVKVTAGHATGEVSVNVEAVPRRRAVTH
ncbi:MAG: alpha/beta fold hydrolase [Acidobacteriota bacterium]